MVCITTDKVYEDREWIWGYREADALGGRDPYSASKAMAEVAIASYRQSYFSPDASQQRAAALASARAGNVIGGGDWAPYRLVPDCMRALMAGEPILLRNPRAIRPWLHVLEALSGYLWLAAKLLQGNGESFAEAWNFGPSESQGINGEKVVQKAIQLWGSGSYRIVSTEAQAESQIWRLNWDKAANRLSWRPLFTWEEALRATVDWFKSYQTQQSASESIDMYAVCVDQIAAYSARARECAVGWAM
jgi:CDP-glucose 4,6-dehydratase